MTKHLKDYQTDLKELSKKAVKTEIRVQEFKSNKISEPSVQLRRIESSKSRINELLSGMFKNVDDGTANKHDTDDELDNDNIKVKPKWKQLL